VKDVASAIEVVIRERIYGSVVVGAVRQDEHGTLIPDQLCMQELLAVTGMRGIEVTKDMAFSTAHRLHRFGVLPAPARDLEMAVYPWSVNPIKLVEHGWRSQVSCQQLRFGARLGDEARTGQYPQKNSAGMLRFNHLVPT
jgi:hypothetical protein